MENIHTRLQQLGEELKIIHTGLEEHSTGWDLMYKTRKELKSILEDLWINHPPLQAPTRDMQTILEGMGIDPNKIGRVTEFFRYAAQKLTQMGPLLEVVKTPITDMATLRVGEYYLLWDKREHCTGTPMELKMERLESDGTWPYFCNRIWAHPENSQALNRWKIFGPIPALQNEILQYTATYLRTLYPEHKPS